MGLDMFLQKAKRMGNARAEELRKLNSYFSYLERPKKYKDSTMEQWCGVSIFEVNRSLIKHYRGEYIDRFASWDTEKKYGWKTIIETVADWRKANHIHKWFVDNIQDGVDDCGIYEVKKEQLEELLDVCKEVVNNSSLIDGEYIEDISVAKDLLPRTDGFLFGSTQYNKWYIEDIKYTIEVVENVLNTTDFDNEIIMYSSSW